jgi:hypothetical protein
MPSVTRKLARGTFSRFNDTPPHRTSWRSVLSAGRRSQGRGFASPRGGGLKGRVGGPRRPAEKSFHREVDGLVRLRLIQRAIAAAASVILLPLAGEGGMRSMTDEGAHRLVRALTASSTDGGGDQPCAPSSVGPQADTFSREGRRKPRRSSSAFQSTPAPCDPPNLAHFRNMAVWIQILAGVAALVVLTPLVAVIGRRLGSRTKGGVALASVLLGFGDVLDQPAKHAMEATARESPSAENDEPPL